MELHHPCGGRCQSHDASQHAIGGRDARVIHSEAGADEVRLRRCQRRAKQRGRLHDEHVTPAIESGCAISGQLFQPGRGDRVGPVAAGCAGGTVEHGRSILGLRRRDAARTAESARARRGELDDHRRRQRRCRWRRFVDDVSGDDEWGDDEWDDDEHAGGRSARPRPLRSLGRIRAHDRGDDRGRLERREFIAGRAGCGKRTVRAGSSGE